MLVNADRKGVKDILEQAQREYALKGVMDSKVHMDEMRANGASDDAIAQAQASHDNLFEAMSALHGHDPQAIQATAGNIAARRARGKSA